MRDDPAESVEQPQARAAADLPNGPRISPADAAQLPGTGDDGAASSRSWLRRAVTYLKRRREDHYSDVEMIARRLAEERHRSPAQRWLEGDDYR